MDITLTRPLVFFDLETTGTNIFTDRIVEIALVKQQPNGTVETLSHRVFPEMRIPPEATAIHGITDADVALEPTFKHLAPVIVEFIRGCDLSGYNVKRFDLPMLKIEFERVGVEFDFSETHVVDVQRIYHMKEPRDLTAAYRFYCGKAHEGAHSALADAMATAEIFQAQVQRYDNLPTDIPNLETLLHPRNPNWVDEDGKFIWDGETAVFNFGKFRGKSLQQGMQLDASYFNWIAEGNFPSEAKEIARKAMTGEYPVKNQDQTEE
jgi:DNA polymerase III subunit epsilon